MGDIMHHTIIVTSWDKERIKKAHKKACKVFPTVSESIESQINGYESFFIPPDGSKEGWAESERGNENRQEFIEWLNSQKYEDGSTPFDWAEIQYGDDKNKDNKMIDCSK